jgi:hypothetical protein
MPLELEMCSMQVAAMEVLSVFATLVACCHRRRRSVVLSVLDADNNFHGADKK